MRVEPFLRAQLTRPLLRVPDKPVVFLLGLLRTAPPDHQSVIDEMIAANRDLFERARAVGGTQYPIGSVRSPTPTGSGTFAPEYGRLAAGKARYDPRHVLTPGQGVLP